MTFRIRPTLLPSFIVAVFACGFGCPSSFAQEFLPNAPEPVVAAVEPVVQTTPQPAHTLSEHKFWDKENIILFSGAAALCAADFTVTHQNLQSGGRELNPIVRIYGRSSAGLALNFSLEAAGGVGLSYLFHRTNHHRLERAVSVFNIGTSAGAVTYGLTHR